MGAGGALGAEGPGAGAAAFPPRILNITVPQVGHLPLMALRPFFIVSSTALEISFFALHLTQYPSGIKEFAAEPLQAALQLQATLRAAERGRQQANWQAKLHTARPARTSRSLCRTYEDGNRIEAFPRRNEKRFSVTSAETEVCG